MAIETELNRLLRLLNEPGSESAAYINRIVEAAKSHLQADVAFLAEFAGDQKFIRHTVGSGATGALAPETAFPLEETYCYRVVKGELPSAIPDAGRDPRVSQLAITAELDIGAYVGVPVALPDGHIFGTLCCVSHNRNEWFNSGSARILTVLSDLVGSQLYVDSISKHAHLEKVNRIETVLEESAVDMVYQPIVDLETENIVGFEALARFRGEPVRPPDMWFREALEVGRCAELELLAVRQALTVLPELPDGVDLSVNVSPDVCVSRAFRDCIAGVDPSRLIVELTEHQIIERYDTLLEALGEVRRGGIRVALDDLGTGYSGLLHFSHIAPDIVKMDRAMTHNICHDVVKQELIRASVNLSQRLGFSIVTEGVECAEDAAQLFALGVEKAQGYYFGRPAPLSDFIK